ncbi:MAG: type II toxin-antitoxin system RelE/ParE family toxin [Proteobacteria bacterium]|nr:type II toxin-antitoxin system RelE/ParE family toxin [Pseudomonadota bacterium]
MITLRFHVLLGDDVREAYQWYEKQRAGLGEDLLMCIEEALGRIADSPLIGVYITDTVYRILTRRFPYGVYYRVKKKELIVVALRHLKRRPLVRYRNC